MRMSMQLARACAFCQDFTDIAASQASKSNVECLESISPTLIFQWLELPFTVQLFNRRPSRLWEQKWPAKIRQIERVSGHAGVSIVPGPFHAEILDLWWSNSIQPFSLDKVARAALWVALLVLLDSVCAIILSVRTALGVTTVIRHPKPSRERERDKKSLSFFCLSTFSAHADDSTLQKAWNRLCMFQ